MSQQELVLAWLASRGIAAVTSSGSDAHMKSNLEVAATAGPRAAGAMARAVRRRLRAARNGPGESENENEEEDENDPFRAAAEQEEMATLMGGGDEYAAFFKRMGILGGA